MTRRLWVIGMIAIVLSGCATMGRNECLTADWETVGFEDGASGQPPQRIGAYRKACANHGVTPDRVAYDAGYGEGLAGFCTYNRGLQAGRHGQVFHDVCPTTSAYGTGYDEGLVSFCTFDSGFTEGLEGKDYQRVCPAEAEHGFLAGYDEGAHIFELRSSRRDLLQHLQRLTDKQKAREKRIAEILADVAVNDELTRDDRIKLLAEAENLRQENKMSAEERITLEIEIDTVEDELEHRGYL